jgi:hypothetical protein
MAFSAFTQDLSLYEKQIFVDGTDTLQCRILTPVNYKKGKKYPLIVLLHALVKGALIMKNSLPGVRISSWIH